MSNEMEKDDDIRSEYDLSGRIGVRGKYYQTVRQGYTIKIDRTDGTTLVQHIVRPEGTVTLEPDVRAFFPDDESVNETLRALIRLLPNNRAKRKSS